MALAQLDSRLGDPEANARRVRETVADARESGADLVVFPELFLSGYALARVAQETARTPSEVAALAPEGAALVGFHERNGSRTYNSAAYVDRGSVVHVHRKVHLVGYEPFGEDALYAAGDSLRAFDTDLGRVAVLICNDAWEAAAPPGAPLVLVPAASSTAVPEAEPHWRELTRKVARTHGCWVVFANRVGDEADFTFWGGSHVVDPQGDVVAEAPRLEEALLLAEVDLGGGSDG